MHVGKIAVGRVSRCPQSENEETDWAVAVKRVGPLSLHHEINSAILYLWILGSLGHASFPPAGCVHVYCAVFFLHTMRLIASQYTLPCRCSRCMRQLWPRIQACLTMMACEWVLVLLYLRWEDRPCKTYDCEWHDAHQGPHTP